MDIEKNLFPVHQYVLPPLPLTSALLFRLCPAATRGARSATRHAGSIAQRPRSGRRATTVACYAWGWGSFLMEKKQNSGGSDGDIMGIYGDNMYDILAIAPKYDETSGNI